MLLCVDFEPKYRGMERRRIVEVQLSLAALAYRGMSMVYQDVPTLSGRPNLVSISSQISLAVPKGYGSEDLARC